VNTTNAREIYEAFMYILAAAVVKNGYLAWTRV
jgi:hypothetical protein